MRNGFGQLSYFTPRWLFSSTIFCPWLLRQKSLNSFGQVRHFVRQMNLVGCVAQGEIKRLLLIKICYKLCYNGGDGLL